MELLERAKTWWEKLGLSSSEAVLVDSAIAAQMRQSTPILCFDCKKSYNSTDFHDCIGKFDVIRVYNNNASNTVWKRLAVKYTIPLKNRAEILKEVQREISEMSSGAFVALEGSYLHKLELIQAGDPAWVIEEELWNS